MTARIMHGDCAEQMRKLRTASVHLCVTSPPYGRLRTYRGYTAFDIEQVAGQLMRVLVLGGVICWVVGSETISGSESLTPFLQAIEFVNNAGLRLHDTMIYEKLNFSNPGRVRYHQVFEYIFVFSKGSPRVFNPIKDKKNVWAFGGTWGQNTRRTKDGSMRKQPRNINTEYGMRGNVWRGKTRGQETGCFALPHPAMMPRWLARDLIISFSNPGDIVIDPFAGSGTTGEEAAKLDRRTILIDSDPANMPLIKKGLDGIITPDKITAE